MKCNKPKQQGSDLACIQQTTDGCCLTPFNCEYKESEKSNDNN